MVIPRALAPSKPIDAAEIYKQIQSSWQLHEQQDLSPAHTANQWLHLTQIASNMTVIQYLC